MQQVAFDREWTGYSPMFVTFENSKNHRQIQVIEYGGAKIQNKSLFATAIEARRMRNFLRVTVKCYKTVTIVFRIHRRCQGTEQWRLVIWGNWGRASPDILGENANKRFVDSEIRCVSNLSFTTNGLCIWRYVADQENNNEIFRTLGTQMTDRSVYILTVP